MSNNLRLQKFLVLICGAAFFSFSLGLLSAQEEIEKNDYFTNELTPSEETNEVSADVPAWFTSAPEVQGEDEGFQTESGILPDSTTQTDLTQEKNPEQNVDTEETESAQYEPGMLIAPMAGISGLQDPFTVSIRTGGEFIHTALISPFYFGGGILLELGFPKEDFPYHYRSGGKEIAPPDLFGCTLYAPAGILYGPFDNKNIQLEMGIRLGFKFLSLVSFESNASSDVHCAFYTAMLIGVDVYNIHVNMDVSYDSVGGLSPGLLVSYRFRIGKRRNS